MWESIYNKINDSHLLELIRWCGFSVVALIIRGFSFSWGDKKFTTKIWFNRKDKE